VDLDHVEPRGPGEGCCGLDGSPQRTGVHRPQLDADEQLAERIGLGESALVERIVEQSVHLVEGVVGRVPVADQVQQRWNRRSTSSVDSPVGTPETRSRLRARPRHELVGRGEKR
jgi:hypothetical protein